MRYHRGLPGRIFLTLALVSFSALFISCGGNEEKPVDASGGTPVQVTHPTRMNLTDHLSLNGNTIFLKKEIVRSTFDGFIGKVLKNIGDVVEPGTMVFQIKTKELAASDSATFHIGSQLFKGSVSIKAGSYGTLTEVDFHEGDYVIAGEQIATISNPSSLRIRLNVPYEDILKVKTGSSCEIDLPNGAVLSGIIEKSVPSVDLSTQTQTFLVKLSRFEAIPENLNVIVKIPFGHFKGAIILPKSSIMTNVTQDAFWIMRLLNDTTAVRANIEKGIENDSVVQVLSPKLDTAERIIVNGAYGLPDTAEVEIVK